MFQTILNCYDVFRSDLYNLENECKNNAEIDVKFSTNPKDYLSENGFYF